MKNNFFRIDATTTRILINLLVLSLSLLCPTYVSASQGLSKRLQIVATQDTVCNVWIFFNERPERSGTERVSEQAALRRQRTGFRNSENCRPVSPRYISEVERRGGTLRHTFHWENAASFSIHSSRLNEIASLPFIKSVSSVGTYTRINDDDMQNQRLGKPAAGSYGGYGGYGWHSDMLNIPMAHDYLRLKNLGAPGSGLLMAFFDSGFRLEHTAFKRIVDSSSIVATYDFVDKDTTVSDPDSVVNDTSHLYHMGDRHGSMVFSIVAAYHPGTYMGVAWGARFALARTEDVVIEARVEEDNWAAAVLWAERLGVDIISSSLGYRDGYCDTTENYSDRDMDGQTTVISLAAKGAVERGVIVVNSMGNETNTSNRVGTITAPADVDGVVAVGAVDRHRTITSFSSTGPTFDRRIKPEVVAPGADVPVINPYPIGHSIYRTASGTSFSAPIVAGVMAMILQAHPGISADSAKTRLYNSCAFAPRQTAVDNHYGHGIPNAAIAVMADNEIFVRITDINGRALVGGLVQVGQKIYTLDTTGYLLTEALPSAMPAEFKISFRGEELYSYPIETLPFIDAVTVNVKRDDTLLVRPTFIKRNRVVKGRYLFSTTDFSTPATAMVRTINGKKIWEQPLYLRPDGTAEFEWHGGSKTGRVAAGVYLVTVRHGNNVFNGRVVVSN